MSKGEDQLFEILKKEFPNYHISRQMPIKIGRMTLYVDLAIKELGLAFEYHGIQHYEFSEFFHKSATISKESVFNKGKARDSLKAQALKEKGFTLVVIPYWENLDPAKILNLIAQACRHQ